MMKMLSNDEARKLFQANPTSFLSTAIWKVTTSTVILCQDSKFPAYVKTLVPVSRWTKSKAI
jgi:hypothetical protein